HLCAAKRIRNFDLTTSKNLGQVVLATGVAVSGEVTDSSASALDSVYLHFFPPGSTDRIYTNHDRTDLSGHYSVVIPPGTYDLHYGPPSGPPYVALAVPSVTIAGDVTLPTVALQAGFGVSGTVLDSVGAGNPVVNVNINVLDAVTGASVTLAHDRSDSTGA